MKTLKALFAVAALVTSSLAMAEGGGDRTFARMEQVRTEFSGAAEVAQKQEGSSPVAEVKESGMIHEKC
ncbi:co-regulatory protein PtrA N-terminal domain-containing protein [Pseudomonas nitroreducens]|uniref:Uncharacterized protein n=1 Tax=Pseudomonas nitroreducens TaxID=46680 RepID=A0A6G6J8L3_PSENT|nr:co-regulatory protein PtrA N-terminal domain-containing protein [Pseudomonas nitroreducens]QIE91410.1 hypothetical protein G5B91_34270 [Pseudomonas nitroreducens]HBO6301720.1 hypothetical protein [Pseudomonas aeruginosa]